MQLGKTMWTSDIKQFERNSLELVNYISWLKSLPLLPGRAELDRESNIPYSWGEAE